MHWKMHSSTSVSHPGRALSLLFESATKVDKRIQKSAKNSSPALAAQPGISELGWAFSASHTAISDSNSEIHFPGNSAHGTWVQVKQPLPVITTSCFWGAICLELQVPY